MSYTFNYVKYDEVSAKKQEKLKELFEEVEMYVINTLNGGRAKSLVLTKLEEAYMWTGKAIRDEQIDRDSMMAHVPERTNQ
jgi:hypothetical protein